MCEETHDAKDRHRVTDFGQETKQLSLEKIDLLFGERALGTLPDDLEAKKGEEHLALRQVGQGADPRYPSPR
jgi:hypothetical protein